MQDIIKITEKQTVSAKDFREFLGFQTRYNDWIGRRISEYGFEFNKDFYSSLSKNKNKGRPVVDYYLGLDMMTQTIKGYMYKPL